MNSDNRQMKINPLSPNADKNEIPLYMYHYMYLFKHSSEESKESDH